jgi:hypothetical protein
MTCFCFAKRIGSFLSSGYHNGCYSKLARFVKGKNLIYLPPWRSLSISFFYVSTLCAGFGDSGPSVRVAAVTGVGKVWRHSPATIEASSEKLT